MASSEPLDDKISLFRQQASIVSRKKAAAAEALAVARDNLAVVERRLAETRSQLGSTNAHAEEPSGGGGGSGDAAKSVVDSAETRSTGSVGLKADEVSLIQLSAFAHSPL